jgi:HlyD family secretion protein
MIYCCLISLLLSACKNKQIAIQPTEEKITESVYASGIIKSRHQYHVFSAVNGLIDAVVVTEGDIVKKGDALIHISNTVARLNTENAKIAADYSLITTNQEKLKELQLNIDQAKIKLDNDALLLERQRNLWAQQIGTANELDQKLLAYKSSENALGAVKSRYAEMQKQISFQQKQSQKNLQISANIEDDYTIKSETDGKVYDILKEKGEMVSVQNPVALIGDANNFILELQVDEYDITRIKPSQKILLSMDSYKGHVFEAVVEKIKPSMNERSKSFIVEAFFVQQPPSLYPNLTCEANIIIRAKDKALLIPRNYLLDSDFVILESHEKRKVKTGLKDYQKVEIVSGLTINDYILKPME